MKLKPDTIYRRYRHPDEDDPRSVKVQGPWSRSASIRRHCRRYLKRQNPKGSPRDPRRSVPLFVSGPTDHMSPDEPRLALNQPSRKHFRHDRLTDEVVIHAVDHARSSRPLDDESNPRR